MLPNITTIETRWISTSGS